MQRIAGDGREIMNKSLSTNGMAAASGDSDPATIVLHGLRAQIEAWAARQHDTPDFPEAVGRLLRLGLARRLTGRTRRTSKSPTASTMAALELDRQGDSAASADQRSDRKKQLIEGPEEFRASRLDRGAG